MNFICLNIFNKKEPTKCRLFLLSDRISVFSYSLANSMTLSTAADKPSAFFPPA